MIEAICKTGLVRTNNEDNIYIKGEYLPLVHGDYQVKKEERPSGIFAVFDGMGGEERGEAASFLAAETLSIISFEPREICQKMSDEIATFSKNKGLRFCGSTACIVSIRNDQATFVNVGDSRIYHIRGSRIKKVSVDDTKRIAGKLFVTQCLGIPREEFMLSPHISKCNLLPGDRIFLCTDGISDLLTSEEILHNDLYEMEKLILKRGVHDNYSGIMLQINQ